MTFAFLWCVTSRRILDFVAGLTFLTRGWLPDFVGVHLGGPSTEVPWRTAACPTQRLLTHVPLVHLALDDRSQRSQNRTRDFAGVVRKWSRGLAVLNLVGGSDKLTLYT